MKYKIYKGMFVNMNKELKKFLEKALLLIALLAIAAIIFIFTYQVNGDYGAEFIYTPVENEDGYITVDGYTGDPTKLEIPEKIDGYTVKYIGTEAFANNFSLKEVTLPKGVTEIGKYAFSGCSDLKTVNLPQSLKKIGHGAFFACSSLKNITLPNGLYEIDVYAFQNCQRLEELKIPASCEIIGTDAFISCENLILDCSENKLAEKIAKQYNIPTDYSESADNTVRKALILLAVVILCIFVLPIFISKIIKVSKNKKHTVNEKNKTL